MTTLQRYMPNLDRMVRVDRQDFDIAANWKVVAEDGIDGYHVFLSGPAHRAFGRFMDGHGLRMINRPDWILLHAGPGSPDSGVYDYRSNIGKGQTPDYVTFFLWPDLLIFTFPARGRGVELPDNATGPERTHEEVVAYTPGGCALDEVTAAAVRWMAEVLGPEDVALNVGVQQGLRSPARRQGRLLIDAARGDMSEHAIHCFQACVLEALGRLPAGSAATLLSPPTEVG